MRSGWEDARVQQQPHRTSPGAQAVVFVPIAAMLLSLFLAPLGLVMGVLSTVVAVRGARAGGPDRAWYRAGVMVGGVAVVFALVGIFLGVKYG